MLKRVVGIFVALMVLSSVGAFAQMKKEDVTITIWKLSREMDDFTKEQIKRFEAKYPGIKVNVVIHENDSGNDYLTAAAAGTGPDVNVVSYPMMSKFIYSGVLAPLNPYMEGWADRANYKSELFDQFKIKGNYYGVPNLALITFVSYNKKLFKEAGITKLPGTWDEFLAAAKKLTNAQKQQAGFGLLVSQWTEWWFEFFVWQAGGDLTQRNPDGTVKLTFTDPAVLKAAQFYRTLIKEKVIQSDITLNYADLNKAYAEGRLGMIIGDAVTAQWWGQLGMKEEDIGFFPFPKGPAGKNPANIGGNCWVITKNTSKAKQDAAWLFATFMTSKEESIAALKSQESKGTVSIQVSPRKDFALTDVVQVNPEFLKITNEQAVGALPEFYGKAQFGSYVDKAVQTIVTKPGADILATFQAAQDAANKEAVEKFNKDILAAK